MLTSGAIKLKARELGFDLCGVAPASGLPELARLRSWLDRGYGGSMHYLARTADSRADVRAVLPTAHSVIVLATLYNTNRPYSTETIEPATAQLSRYAWGDDYHDVLGRRLDQLLAWMRDTHGEPFDAERYVDTGPVQERVLAQHGGLGWIGKNTCLINSNLGSWLFLSEIVSSLPLEPDEPVTEQCGACSLCLEVCPTEAFVEPWVLDASRCLSYLTIELRGPIPESLRERLGSHVFGCDLCQEVCPWNLHAPRSNAMEWQPRPLFDEPGLLDLWRHSDQELRQALKGSAMKRTGIKGLRRNLAVALGNAGPPGAGEALSEGLDDRTDESLATPIVAEHIAWATRRLRSRG